MSERIYKLIPREWHPEMKMFTENEFKGIVTIKGKIEEKSSDEINSSFNNDEYNPRDGEIVEAVDHFAAFIEAYLELKTGTSSQPLKKAQDQLRNKYMNKTISGINFGEMYADFD